MGNVYAALVQRAGSVHAACRQRAFHMCQEPYFYPTEIVITRIVFTYY